MSHEAWWLVLDGLAAYRLTHLIVDDSIIERPRRYLVEHGPSWAATLVTCSWCISVWVAAGVVVLTRLAPGVWQYPAFALALSAVAGFLQEH